ncbi:polypyrimidine tract-binding protein homolog 1-like isoform X1 [Populus nigra]|uniref:polypyrimidine tract-binding protein homolog 1-like isoform X1 n=1 Tax=Populus nigra TaxID=3691 RepID=UPI002B265278|nr:polypyrimidine tract-binding protein homolog 1-like isoform X1 [Populus nigra]
MSTSGQPQFRYTQTPSKVLHLRNLPWECTEEELIELCKPFGRIVNTKCNVGANRNQAFVEFVDQNQAIQMVSYYASSSDPAQVRGKTVYIQYSNRHEIVNNKSPGDNPGNVLLVTIEGVEAGDVSIDVIHLVFSAFGYVHKIATFEKAAGFQALIQFTDSETASSARNALDGRSIPRYLLPEHVGSCHLRISYSAHTDLNIKFQSHRSRDYTNPYLPVNPTAIEGPVQPTVGADGKKKEPESNVLLASIENMQYAVTIDVLHTVFSAFGTVQKIAIFEKNGGTQALIQYPDVAIAAVAKETLEGHCIYDGGYCKLHLSYSRHTDLNVKAYSDKSRDYTIPDASLIAAQAPGLHTAPTMWQNPQAGSMYTGNNYATTAAVPVQVPPGQVPAWDPTMQASGQGYASVPGTYPGQTYPTPPVSAYATAAIHAGPSPRSHSSPISHSVASMAMSHPGMQSNLRPSGASPPGQPPYYG